MSDNQWCCPRNIIFYYTATLTKGNAPGSIGVEVEAYNPACTL